MNRPRGSPRDTRRAAGAALAAGIAIGLASALAARGSSFAGWGRPVASLLAWWGLGVLAIACFRLARSHPREVLLSAVSLLATLGAFDLWARSVELPAGLPRVSPMGLRSRPLHHGYPPDRALATPGPAGWAVFRTNPDGLRTRYTRESFRGRALRVAALGDSFTFGLGVPDGAPWPERLEEVLRNRHGTEDLAVLNAGVVSYSPYLEHLLFERVVAEYEPRLVLVMLDAGDIGDDHAYASDAERVDGRVVFPTGVHPLEAFRYHGPLWQLAAPLRLALGHPWARLSSTDAEPSLAARAPVKIGDTEETNAYFVYRHPLEETRPYFENTLAALRALGDAVRGRGARLVVFVAPRYHHWSTRESPRNWERFRYALDEPYQYEYFRFFEEAASRVDFPILSLLPAFRASEEFPLVFEDDPHWNERGHAFVARTLARLLEEQGLISGR